MSALRQTVLFLGVATLGGCTALLGTFDVDPNAGPGALDGATPETSQPDGGGGGGGDAATDSGLTCAPGTADCDNNPSTGCETDVRVSTDHCGACGRKCGGTATCAASECTVERLRDGLDHPFALETAGPRILWLEQGGTLVRGCRADDCAASTAALVDVNGGTIFPSVDMSPRQLVVIGSNFYFAQTPPGANSDAFIASCDVGGCKLTGATAVSPTGSGNRRPTQVVAGPGSIFTYQGIDGLIRTAIPGGAQSYAGTRDTFGALHAGAAALVYVDENSSQANPTGGVFTNPGLTIAGNPTRLLPPAVKHLAVSDGVAFTSTGGPAAATGSITSCALTGCSGAGDILAKDQAYVRDLAADGDDLYWVTAGAADVKTNAASIGTVMRCKLPGCPGGPRKVADALSNPVAIRLTPTHAYWVTFGTPGTSNGAVYRVRR
jgi:hypothetical protein